MLGEQNIKGIESRIIPITPVMQKVGCSNRLLISTHTTEYVIEINNIVCLQAESNYTRVYLQDERLILASKPIRYFQNKLSRHKRFFRVHQSYMVNFSFIQFWNHKQGIQLTHRVDKIPVSRRKKSDVLKWLQQLSV